MGVICLKLDGESPVCAEVGIRPIIQAFPTFLIFKGSEFKHKIEGGDWRKLEGMLAQLKA